MQLKELLFGVSIESVFGTTSISINHVTADSRQVESNALFVAIRGEFHDGHQHVDDAVKNGAIAILCEELPKKQVEGITYVQSFQSRIAYAVVASNYHNRPSAKLSLIGVTGTNGKTSIVQLLFEVFQHLGFSVGKLSTIANAINEHHYPATHTTPDPMEINSFLEKMVEAGVSYCFMEVSSHGIDQHRIEGLHFTGGIFTNLTHDHLDYHKTIESYRDTKKKFFDKLPATAFALSNHDDKNGKYMLQNCAAKQHSYALKNTAEFKAKILEHDFSGMQLWIDGKETWVALVGDFNASNMLAVYACTQLLGENADQSLSALSAVEPVSGRFNVVSGGHPVRAIVDYAHTPDALNQVLETINKIRTGNEMLITVFGCGGDRDKAKRPLMGRIASTLSDKVIFTSDNPRNEDPEKIIEQLESGVPAEHFKKYISISSRLQAIKTACQLAHSGDIILVAGKGHETYQDIKGERLEFDDVKELKQHLQNKN